MDAHEDGLAKLLAECSECKFWFRRDKGQWINHFEKHHRAKMPKTYAFTFTTGAKAEDFAKVEDELVEAALKLFRQESVPVQEGEAFLEYTEEGRPHIHGWYKTTDGGRIFSKVFHRAWPEWAEKRGKTKFAGGYHEEMKSNRYVGYANSEGRLVASVKKSAQ